MTTHCSRSKARNRPQTPCGTALSAPESVANSTATATKLSQKPGCHSAQGSGTTTTAQVSSHTSGHGQRRPLRRKSATAASMDTVRCAGTPQPLNSAYAAASATPHTSAADGAGHARHRRGERRQSHCTAAAASQANKVMCRPEMLIRWATPVARNTSQSARSMARWSPVTRAATTPATRTACASVASGARRAMMASRTAWRSCSTGACAVAPRRCGGTSRAPART